MKQIIGQETIHGYEGELKEDKMGRKQVRWKDKKEEGLVQPGRVCYKLVAVSFIAVTDSYLHGFGLGASNRVSGLSAGIRSEDKGVDSGLGWGPRRGVETRGEEVEEGGDKEAGNEVGWTDDLGGLETDVGTQVSSGVSGVCLFGCVLVTWRIYILLRSDSKGIWTLPETEGRGVGSASSQ